jgi:hypothetical protein
MSADARRPYREAHAHRVDHPTRANATKGIPLEIPKDKILDLIREHGKSDQVQQAEQELPDQVDPEQHSDLLEKYGLQPQDVLSKLGVDIPGL